ncbi:MAG: HD domain-containing protein [Proteobacteria bacterium]|nr:HD domain-containing protein [Pseudomonadota bacterium]
MPSRLILNNCLREERKLQVRSRDSGAHQMTGYSRQTETLKLTGKVRDPLHDTIAFTQLEKHVIDSFEFQRLRRIQQTAFIKYVFPGATHTRFVHALGVMHMAGVMLNSLIANQERILAALTESLEHLPQTVRKSHAMTELHHGSLTGTREALEFLRSADIAQIIRLAALLHDVGHAPFSHSLERFMPSWNELEQALDGLELPAYLQSAFRKKIEKQKSKSPKAMDARIRHEIYTLMIVARIFSGKHEHADVNLGQDVCAVLDPDVEPAQAGLLERSGLQSLLHEVVSGEIDVDRMDYLLRDSRECGVVYGLFDAGRILDSACFYKDPLTSRYHLAIRRSGVAAFEDYLRARWSMYQQVYFHKTATACEAMLEAIHKSLNRFSLPLDLNNFLKLDDSSFMQFAHSQSSGNQARGFGLLEDLLHGRKLWKRVYEESIPSEQLTTAPSLCPATLNFLRTQGVPSEMIESSTSLTRFSPKGRNRQSRNTLKVVVKDVHGLRFLEPIEMHSRLVNRLDEEVVIRRIFVSREDDSGTLIDPKVVQQRISTDVVGPRTVHEH